MAIVALLPYEIEHCKQPNPSHPTRQSQSHVRCAPAVIGELGSIRQVGSAVAIPPSGNTTGRG